MYTRNIGGGPVKMWKSLLAIIVLVNYSVCVDDFAISKEYPEWNRQFASAIYKELSRSVDGNFLVCPLSVQTVMALASAGARGETAQQITRGLILPDDPEQVRNIFRTLSPTLKGNEFYSLTTANKIFVSNTFKINKTYQAIAENAFGAQVDAVDFSRNAEAAEKINYWVEQKTNNKIHQVVSPEDINGFTKVLLVNAMHFKAKWKVTFDVQDTTKRPFYQGPKVSQMVDMMHVTDLFNYYEHPLLDCKFLELPYVGMDLSMIVVLPNKVDGLAMLEENIGEVLKNQPFIKQFVKVQIPRFSLETTVQFKPLLQKLGIEKVFGESADLSGMSADGIGNLYIDKVIQKTFINVTESGTEAAAATSGSVLSLSIPAPDRLTKLQFIADHPFLYCISLSRGRNPSRVLLFKGRFNNRG